MKIRSQFLTKLAAWIVVFLVRRLFATLRSEFVILNHDTDLVAYDPHGKGRYLYCTWHDSILFPLFMGTHPHSAGLVSRHQDGSYLAECMRLINVKQVRGSSHRGAAQALRESLSVLTTHHLTITPDGPRGPRRTMKDGIVYLASKSGRPIVPLSVECSSAWHFQGKWTDLVVPKPFSRVRLILGEPLYVPDNLTREQLLEITNQVQARMDDIYQQAETRKAA